MYIVQICRWLFCSRYYVPQIAHGRILTFAQKKPWGFCQFSRRKEKYWHEVFAGYNQGCPFLSGSGDTLLCLSDIGDMLNQRLQINNTGKRFFLSAPSFTYVDAF